MTDLINKSYELQQDHNNTEVSARESAEDGQDYVTESTKVPGSTRYNTRVKVLDQSIITDVYC